MTGDMKRLLRELDLERGCPTVDAKAIKRRVNAALNAAPSERKAYMRQKVKIAVVLVAAVVALTGTVLAVGPTMWTMLTKALGSFAPYAQVIEGVSATDQGLRITVEAAMSDKSIADVAKKNDEVQFGSVARTKTIVYVSVTDLKGDRLNENTTLDGDKCVSYDPDSRTALFRVSYGKALDVDGTISLNFGIVRPGYVRLDDLGFPQELLKDRTLSTQVVKGAEIDLSKKDVTEAVVLKPGQTPIPMEGTNLFSISSAGFDRDGIYHILYEIADGVTLEYAPIYNTLAFDDGRKLPISYSTRPVWFGDGKYLDVAYISEHDELNDWPTFLTRESVSYLTYDDACVDLYTEPQIEGAWNLTFPVDTLPVRTITVNQPLGGLMVKSVSLTAISATADVEPIPGEKVRYRIPGLPLTLYLDDGSHITVDDNYIWTFDKAVELEHVSAMSIGMWYIPLEGDAALPGHWLSELPQSRPPV